MAKVKVKLADNIARVVMLDTDATNGAKLGTNLFLPSGVVATPASLAAYIGVSGSGTGSATAHRLLSGLTLGDDHPQYARKDILTTRGDLYAKGPTVVQRLAMGTAKQLLRVNDAGTDPAWATISPTITLGTDLSGNLTLTDLASGTLNATIVANSVTDTKLRDSAALSVIGRSANTSGDPADIVSAGSTDILRRSGTAIGFGTIDHTYVSDFTEAVQDVAGIEFVDSSEIDFTYDDPLGTVTATLIDGSVAYTRLAQLSALSILGRSANSSGVMAAITAGTDGQTLRRSGTTLGFGALDLANANAITGDLPFANLAQGSALSVLGVTGNATADVASIAAAADGNVLRRSGTAVSFGAIDISSSNAVTNRLAFANFTQGSARSVLAVSGASTADFASVSAGSDDTVLSRTAGSLSFGQLTVGMFPASVVTYAKIQNVSATSRVLGRITAGAGVIEELTGANLATIIGTSLGANPTASVGLAAVNGSASTYMRSDAAPALDVTVSPTWSGTHTFSNTPVVPAASWTYAKIQNVSATSRVLGRVTAGAGVIEELTLSQMLDFVGSAANGDLLYRSGGAWTRLAIGSSTNVLTVSGGLPVWAAAGGGGGTPGGADTNVQFNDGGAFGGQASFSFAKATNVLTLGATGTAGVIQGAAPSTTTSTGSSLSLRGGAGGSTSGNGGALLLLGATPTSGNGGGVSITPGAGVGGNAVGGSISLTGGDSVGSGTGAGVTIQAGNSNGTGTGGALTIASGAGGSTSGNGGLLTIRGGSPQADGNGGNIAITTRDGLGSNRNGGSLIITIGSASGGTGVNGVLQIDQISLNGAQIATFTATNKPGTGTTAVSKWLPVKADGIQYYIPMWQ